MTRGVLWAALATICLLSSAQAQELLPLHRGGGEPPVVATNGAPPGLSINRVEFCTSDNDWSVFVSQAAPNSGVFLEEWRFTGSGWVPNWSGGIGTTNGAGQLGFTAGAPTTLGSHIAQVTVGGQTSNPVFYNVFACR